jgi:hypothetical protein
VVAVGIAAACAAADAAAAVVGDVECCGGGVEARDLCADSERRYEDEEDDNVDDAGDAAAAKDERCLDEPGLLERAGLRDAAELGLSSAGVSGGREGWAGSGAVAAVAAATMPSRCRGGAGRRSGYARRPRGNADPRGSSFAAPSPGTACAPAAAGGLRIDDAPATSEHEGEQCYSCGGWRQGVSQ